MTRREENILRILKTKVYGLKISNIRKHRRIDIISLLTEWKKSVTRGPKGPRGSDGSNGIDGVNGVDGIDGIHGSDGVDGVDGPLGPRGPRGPCNELKLAYMHAHNAAAILLPAETTLRLRREHVIHPIFPSNLIWVEDRISHLGTCSGAIHIRLDMIYSQHSRPGKVSLRVQTRKHTIVDGIDQVDVVASHESYIAKATTEDFIHTSTLSSSCLITVDPFVDSDTKTELEIIITSRDQFDGPGSPIMLRSIDIHFVQ